MNMITTSISSILEGIWQNISRSTYSPHYWSLC